MKYVGVKKVLKSAKNEKLKLVYIADDAEAHITKELMQICKDKNIEIKHVNTMAELGKIAGIEVGTSAMAEL